MKPTSDFRSALGGAGVIARLAACCLFAVLILMWAAAAQAQWGPPPLIPPQKAQNPADDLSDHWMINGNGWPGALSISQALPGGAVQGTMYGDRVVGYFSKVERTMVLVRYSSASLRPMQAFVGSVGADGRTWSGRFHGLDVNWSGASEWANTWSFSATRGTASAPPAPPAVVAGAPGPRFLSPAFNFYNRPQEFGTTRMSLLEVTVGRFSNPGQGQIDGTLFGDEFIGTYSQHTGSLVFLRLSGGEPAQLYVGRVEGGAAAERDASNMSGVFYALTEGMGADESRQTYDWRADQSCDGLLIC